MATIVGTYQHQSSENLDAFFTVVGVPWVPRKIMTNTSPRVEISKEDDTIRIRTVTMFKTLDIRFKLDEKFEDALMSGEKTQNVIRQEGDSLIQYQESPKGHIVITRTFKEDGMDMTFEHKESGTKATRHFRRVA